MSEIKFHPYMDGLVKYALDNPVIPMWELSTTEVRRTRNGVIAKLMGPGRKGLIKTARRHH